MPYCTNCGLPQQNGVAQCQSCASQLPGQQLMARLETEAANIRRTAAANNAYAQRQNGFSQPQNGQTTQVRAPIQAAQAAPAPQMSTLDRLEEMRSQADALAQKKYLDQQGRPLRG
jgi:hypothetical protein